MSVSVALYILIAFLLIIGVALLIWWLRQLSDRAREVRMRREEAAWEKLFEFDTKGQQVAAGIDYRQAAVTEAETRYATGIR